MFYNKLVCLRDAVFLLAKMIYHHDDFCVI